MSDLGQRPRSEDEALDRFAAIEWELLMRLRKVLTDGGWPLEQNEPRR